MNLYKREIYKKSLQHAERRNHKYLYKIGDRYIYPEDVAGKAKSTASNIGSMVTAAGTAAKTKISNTIADQKQKHKDRKFVKSSNPGWSNEGANRRRIETEKRNEESLRKHIQSPEYKQGEYNRKASEIGDEEAYKRMVASNRPGRRKSSELEKQKEKTAERKKVKELAKEKVDAQRKSAHAGYEGRIKKRNATLRARSQEIGADIEGKKRREEKLRKEDVYENANYKYDDWYDGGNYVPIVGHHTKRTVGSTGERLPFNAPGMLKAISDTNRRKVRKKKVKDQIRSAHRSAR